MYACKVTCRTTLYHDFGNGTPNLASTKALFHAHYQNPVSDCLRVTDLSNYKHWKNQFNEVAATALVEVLVPYERHVDFIEDYESLACRLSRRLLPIKGAAIQVIESEWLTPYRSERFYRESQPKKKI
ncbi:hypothetical protein [Shouchella rhizosphaerae]|uniref:Queuosine biosynthesis protein QueD n=1 Tax=Shouchella rhizosphaerae TaxID=866786 RepID=A0ABZ2CU63_9BACI